MTSSLDQALASDRGKTCLTSLELNIRPDTCFDEAKGSRILKSLGTLQGLRKLKLKGVRRGGSEARSLITWLARDKDSISAALPRLTTLELDLRKCSISDAGAQGLAAALAELPQLTALTLRLLVNDIKAAGAKALAAALGKLPQLTSLTLFLRRNSIGAAGAEALAAALGKLPQLTALTLDLDGNSIGDAGAEALAAALGELLQLTALKLDLQDNSFGDAGAEALAAVLAKLPQLTALALNFGNNSIGDAGALAKLFPASSYSRDASGLSFEWKAPITSGLHPSGAVAPRQGGLSLPADLLGLDLAGCFTGSFTAALSNPFISNGVVIVGAGPVGLCLALMLAEYGAASHIFLVERRIKKSDGSSAWAWRELQDGNRRREQVVTLQDDVVELFRNLSFSGDFEGERVWLSSRNVAIRDLEDRLLDRVQANPSIELIQGPPRTIWEALRQEAPPTSAALAKYRDWLAAFKADLVVAADGAGSFTRAAFGFEWRTLGAQDPDNLVQTDYALGIGLLDDPAAGQAQALNTTLTLAQCRYLFNSERGKRGYLNIRLTPAEYAALKDANGGRPCSFAAPVELYDMYRSPTVREDGVVPLSADLPKMRHTVAQGLKLFGLSEDHVSSIVGIPLTPAYATSFVAAVGESSACLVGDAAMSHHFWPGRGLNTGLKAAVGLARALHRSCTLQSRDSQLTELFKFDAFMQELREREMQGRSTSMLRRSTQLPDWIDEIESLPTGQVPSPDSRTAEILRDAGARRSELDKTLSGNVKAWRDFNEQRGSPTWPHPKLPDSEIDLKLVERVSRQGPLTCKIMNDSAVRNLGRDGSFNGRAGWPVHQMAGTSTVRGEVSPAVEQTSSGHYKWPDPVKQAASR